MSFTSINNFNISEKILFSILTNSKTNLAQEYIPFQLLLGIYQVNRHKEIMLKQIILPDINQIKIYKSK